MTGRSLFESPLHLIMAPEQPLRIVIIGAGLGGCASAFCFARHGHDVTVLEQRSSLSPQGTGIMIRPGASRVFISWGLGSDFDAISDTSPSIVIRSVKTGEILQRNVPIDIAETPDWGTDRETALILLYEKAVQVGAKFEFNATMSDVSDTSSSTAVTLKDGRSLPADLIIGADGIRSRTRGKVLSDITTSIDPIISNNTLFGVRILGEAFTNAPPEARRLVESPHLNVYIAPSQYVVARWGVRSDRFGALFATLEDTGQQGLWDEDGDIEFVRKAYAKSALPLRAALEMADRCDRWKLAEMPDLPRWTSTHGRVILLGDSAHGMLPNAAQGFSQIVEDIGALEYLLKVKGDNIAEATRLWQEVRKPRVERIKAFASWNTRVFLGEEEMKGVNAGKEKGEGKRKKTEMDTVKSLKGTMPDMHAAFHTSAFLKWAHDYDVVGETKKYLGAKDAKL